MVTTGMDVVSVFGFVSGFFTLVLIGHRHQLQTRLPVIVIGMACCAAYGFLAGAWPVGFVLIAITASEFRRWAKSPGIPAGRRDASSHRTAGSRIEFDPRIEQRIERMFGPA
jgi:hypothetical protein